MAQASKRDQRIARVIDREVAPVWHDRFARMMYRELPRLDQGLVLDVHCATGRTTAELLKRLDGSNRVVGLEPSEPNLALARSKVRPDWKQRVYFKAGDITDVTEMSDDTYDLTLANLVLGEAHDWQTVATELARVTKPGGEVLATLPLRGSWAECEDLLYEVLLHAGLDDAVRRLSRLAQIRPTGESLATGLQKMGLGPQDFVIEQERFHLLYPSGREFLFSPSVEHGPLRLWKAIIGDSAKPQELFWRLKETIDSYFAGTVFSVTVVAGLVRIGVGSTGKANVATRHWNRYPELDAVFDGRAQSVPEDDDEDLDIDLDIDLDEDEDEDEDELAASSPEVVTEESHESDDAAIFAAMGQTPEEDDEGLEGMLDSMFDAATTDDDDLAQEAEPVIEASAPRGRRPGPRGETTASRLGLKIGSTAPRVPPPPPTGPQKAVPHPSGSHALPGKGRRRDK